MDIRKDYFLCDQCRNKNFVQIYNFSVHFRKVNFSVDPIHDEVTDVIYQCTHCKKTFSKHQIESALKEMVDGKLRAP
jgi:hypothetical protein